MRERSRFHVIIQLLVWVRTTTNNQVTVMVHLLERETLLRANSAVMLALIGGGLIACALGAVVFDIGRAFGTW
jgi:hypothetical protein